MGSGNLVFWSRFSFRYSLEAAAIKSIKRVYTGLGGWAVCQITMTGLDIKILDITAICFYNQFGVYKTITHSCV